MIEHNLNSRMFRLYNFLKLNGDNWITQEYIARTLYDLYPATENDFKDFHNSKCRKLISKDIQTINESDYLPKPILSGAKGVKIANEREFDLYIATNMNAVLKRLKRLKKLADKGNQNGQYRLKMTEYQSEIIDAFVE